MIPDSWRHSLASRLDQVALYTMNRRVPPSLETTVQDAPAFEEVLANTAINRQKTAVSNLFAPGIHPIWLDTLEGQLRCQVRVHLAIDPQAPLLLYHHGFNEGRYDASWKRLFPRRSQWPLHNVCIQAPYHTNWTEPMAIGFSSLQNIYQMLAGSMRMMELLQHTFAAQGARYTVLVGVSWGGITSLLYEGLFQQTRAVIPMLSSPNLAQVIWDVAELFRRPLKVSQEGLFARLDFTPYYRRIASGRVFPVLAEHDQFFRLEHHAPLFAGRPLVTVPGSHITALWRIDSLRLHVMQALTHLQNLYAQLHTH